MPSSLRRLFTLTGLDGLLSMYPPYFWHNGVFPTTEAYRKLFDSGFASWRLKLSGLVDKPVELNLDDLRALPRHEQITQHYCIQGWSGVAKWDGVSMATIMDLVRPLPEARWGGVLLPRRRPGRWPVLRRPPDRADELPPDHARLRHERRPLSYGHGAPARLRNEVQLGFKQVKWLAGIEFVAHFSEVGSGYGGYNLTTNFSATANPFRTIAGCSIQLNKLGGCSDYDGLR